MKKIIGKITCIILLIFLCLFCSKSIVKADSGNLHLNKLEFKVYINSDGSMNVTELWNIDIRNTNTLFKTFEIDKEKYSSISNVKVVEKTSGKNYEFSKINTEMYHVTANSYYALENSDGKFEIAWGVGMDHSSGNRVYQISYKVNDAIAKYNDYAELYWQFVGNDFSIDADTITGTIILPSKANDIQEIKVWGHTEGLNGEIYATGKDEIKFQINDYKNGNMVEIRSLFPNSMIKSSERTYNQNRYDEVLKEETKWANRSNLKRQWEEIKDEVIWTFIFYVILAVCIIYIEKAVKYGKKIIQTNKYKSEQKLDYYRELPKEDTTPGEALYILREPYNGFRSCFGNIFSANILNLKLKEYLDIRVEKESENSKKEKIYIKDKRKDLDTLKKEEKSIVLFIRDALGKNNEIEMKELEKYIKGHAAKVSGLIERNQISIEHSLSKDKLLDKKAKIEYKQYKEKASIYFFIALFSLIYGIIPCAIVFLINGILCHKISKKQNVLTQDGVNMQEKWKGLKKYMEDFSLLDEKEIPALTVWEKFLVYATAFGVANKVLKQLKTVYPNIDEIDTIGTSASLYFMYHSNFTSSFSSSINSSISSTYSSGSGSGGGFSGGGGGGRWPEVAVVEDRNH